MARVVIRKTVELTDPEYFCNKSWTLSYNINTQSWVSFHSYIPNWYIAENNFFYSGKNDCCSNFDFIAATQIPEPPTTTSTTTYVPKCELEGFVVVVTTTTTTTAPPDCDFTGEVTIVTTTTTTSSSTTTSTTTEAPTTTTTTTETPTTTTTTTEEPTTTTTTTTEAPTTTTTTTQEPTTTTTTTTEEPTTTTSTTSTSSTTTTTTTQSPTTTTTTTEIPTTTTTTTHNPLYGWRYDVTLYRCDNCTYSSAGSISNSEPLNIGKWYFNSIFAPTGKMYVVSSNPAEIPVDNYVSISTEQDTCEDVICNATTTTTTTI